MTHAPLHPSKVCYATRSGVATRTNERATKAGSLLRCQISAIAIHSKTAFFPYNNSCHVNYSAQNYLCPKKISEPLQQLQLLQYLSTPVSRDAYTITSYKTMLISIPCNSDNKGNGNNNIALLQCM